MSLLARVEDGKIQTSASQSSLSGAKETKSVNDAYDKDTFLQLLVAEVKYQDPLEPSSNTEWVSQYATFSELESMQNMSASYDLSRASALVGKHVILKVTGETGKTDYVEGKVEYVTYEGNKAFLSIDGNKYSIDDLYNVVDETYLGAYNKVYDWTVSLNKLPAIGELTLDEKDKVESLYKEMSDMTEYEMTFVSTENEAKIKEYYARMQDLITAQKAKEEAANEDSE